MNKKFKIITIIFLIIILILTIYLTRNKKYSSLSSNNLEINEVFLKNEQFTNRDLEQTADLTDKISYTVENDQDIEIKEEGVYVITGNAEDVTIYIEANDEEKVQLVLTSLNITNKKIPCIYVKSADKVFITTSKDSSLSVTGSFEKDENNNLDAVIYSKSDIVFNGTANLTINSTENGIDGKDDLKITGGEYTIKSESKAIVANDSIKIYEGTLNLVAGTDGLHSENSDNQKLGYIYICGGNINIISSDDGIHGNSVVQIDDGNININSVEGIESTYIQINGGTISIDSTSDGINAANKSNAYNANLEINGGKIDINVSTDDADAIDSNGDVNINGGNINLTAKVSSFDYVSEAKMGTFAVLIINGTQVNEIPKSSK